MISGLVMQEDIMVVIIQRKQPMKYRNNVKSCIQIPQYANLTVYDDVYHLTVTLNTKLSTIAHIITRQNTIWKTKTFRLKGKYYISAQLDIPFKKLVNYNIPATQCIWDYSSQMLNSLKIILREAKIKELHEEIKQLSLF